MENLLKQVGRVGWTKNGCCISIKKNKTNTAFYFSLGGGYGGLGTGQGSAGGGLRPGGVGTGFGPGGGGPGGFGTGSGGVGPGGFGQVGAGTAGQGTDKFLYLIIYELLVFKTSISNT